MNKSKVHKTVSFIPGCFSGTSGRRALYAVYFLFFYAALFAQSESAASGRQAAWPEQKLPCLLEKNKVVSLVVQLSPGNTVKPEDAPGQAIRIKDHYAPLNIWVIEGPTPAISAVVHHLSGVLRAECAPASMREEIIVPGHNLYLNRFDISGSLFPGVDGSDIHVSVKEQRFDTTDVDLLGRIGYSPGAAPFRSDHASQMATLVGGSGTSSRRARGGAPGVYLHSSGLSSFLPDPPERYDQLDISVQNHSYGSDIGHDYTLSAQAYDHSTRLRPSLLHVFSAGNEGMAKGGVGPYAALSGFANLTGGFKMAKSALVVAGVDSTGRLWPFSSRGPSADGRIKPDIAAFGQGGTSESAALVSAAAALLGQELREQQGTLPAAALVRALLLTTARDAGMTGPDFEYGYGLLDVAQAVSCARRKQYKQEQIQKGSPQKFPFEVETGASRLQLTLTWNDLPGALTQQKSLQNDLDSWLTDPNGQVHRPWSKPHQPDSVGIAARPGVDTLNTVEQITVVQPAPGTWTLWVDPSRLTTPQQSCAWAWHTRDTSLFQWDFPRHGDVLTARKDAFLYWNLPNPTSIQGALSWRRIGDTLWQKIADTVDLRQPYYRWRVPDITTAAQWRMETAGQMFLSDTGLVEPPLRMEMGFFCADSLYFSWLPTAPHNGLYTVSGLGTRYLEPLFSTSDTFVVLAKQQYPQQRFSIRHRFSATLEGAPAPAPDINLQGAGCYINSFYGVARSSAIELTASLGTTHATDSLFFEKRNTLGLFSPIAGQRPALTATTQDLQPLQGLNQYRVALKMQRGLRVFSDTLSLWHAGPLLENLVFPNPFPVAGGHLHWLTTIPVEGNEALLLYDVSGRLLLKTPLGFDNDLPVFVLPSLPVGIYSYAIRRTEGLPVRGLLIAGK